MWSLIRNHETGAIVDLFQTDDTAVVNTSHLLEQFPSRGAALTRIAELGLTYINPESHDISKLTIRRRLRAAGLEGAFDAALDANPQAKADWTDAQMINTNDPLVLAMLPQLQAALHLSDELIDGLLQPEES